MTRGVPGWRGEAMDMSSEARIGKMKVSGEKPSMPEAERFAELNGLVIKDKRSCWTISSSINTGLENALMLRLGKKPIVGWKQDGDEM